MSLAQYLEHMESVGVSRKVVLDALWRHASYIEDHGLLIGASPGMHSVADVPSARKYAEECRRMVQEEANKQVIREWLDMEFVRQCVDENGGR